MYRELTRIVRIWSRKDSFDSASLKSAAQDSIDENRAIAALLTASACGLDEEWLSPKIDQCLIEESDRYFARLFFVPTDEKAHTILDRTRFERLFIFTACCVIRSPDTNLAAARLQSVFWRAERSIAVEYTFYLTLTSFIGGVDGGPLREFTLNTIDRSNERVKVNKKNNQVGHIRYNDTAGVKRLRDALQVFWVRIKKEKRVEGLWTGRTILEGRLRASQQGAPSLIRSLNAIHQGAPPTRKQVILETELNFFLSEALPKVLQLSPASQWACALSYEFAVRNLENPLNDKHNSLTQVVNRLKRDSLEEPGDCFCFAWHLLNAVWHKIFDDPSYPVSRGVVELARRMRHPAVRIAIGILELVLESSEVSNEILLDLKADPDCGKLMQRVGWTTKPNHKAE